MRRKYPAQLMGRTMLAATEATSNQAKSWRTRFRFDSNRPSRNKWEQWEQVSFQGSSSPWGPPRQGGPQGSGCIQPKCAGTQTQIILGGGPYRPEHTDPTPGEGHFTLPKNLHSPFWKTSHYPPTGGMVAQFGIRREFDHQFERRATNFFVAMGAGSLLWVFLPTSRRRGSGPKTTLSPVTKRHSEKRSHPPSGVTQ